MRCPPGDFWSLLIWTVEMLVMCLTPSPLTKTFSCHCHTKYHPLWLLLLLLEFQREKKTFLFVITTRKSLRSLAKVERSWGHSFKKRNNLNIQGKHKKNQNKMSSEETKEEWKKFLSGKRIFFEKQIKNLIKCLLDNPQPGWVQSPGWFLCTLWWRQSGYALAQF